MIDFDAILYPDDATLPDLGSIRLVNRGARHRMYMGNAADKSKLPTISRYPQYRGVLDTGAAFFAIDTREVLFYDESADAWK